MTRWKYTTYSPDFNFEQNVIYNGHISTEPKDFVRNAAIRGKRQIGRGAKHVQSFEKAVQELERKGMISRWTSSSFIHYSVITEFGLDYREDTKGLTMWCSNKWNGLPDKYNDVLTFMILSCWRFDKNLRTQEIEVNVNTDHIARRLCGAWSTKDIEKRIAFLRKNGNLNGNMLSELTFSHELEEVYQIKEMD